MRIDPRNIPVEEEDYLVMEHDPRYVGGVYKIPKNRTRVTNPEGPVKDRSRSKGRGQK